jgi:uncharacterized membrane protein (DUF4010 family)
MESRFWEAIGKALFGVLSNSQALLGTFAQRRGRARSPERAAGRAIFASGTRAEVAGSLTWRDG